MSEHLLRICTEELTTLRVRCGACKVILEVPATAEAVGRVFKDMHACPVCKASWPASTANPTPLRTLAVALDELQRDTGPVAVEFVVKPPA